MYDGLQEEYLIQFRLQDEDREVARYQQIHEAAQQPAAPAGAQPGERHTFQQAGWTAVLKRLFGPALAGRVAH